jgi:predicted DNA binding CopG/RHH family protein
MTEPMMKRPKFANEKEEAEWWDANPEYILQQFELGKREGRLTHGTAAKRLGLSSTVPTTIRLSEDDLAKARMQAEKKGLRYQTYLKMLLHEALSQSSRADEDFSPTAKPGRTPQEKKKLSLERDRRNVYGENDKASRKNIPAGKQRGHQALRRNVNQALALETSQKLEPKRADEMQFAASTAIIAGERNRFRKRPDAALGDVLKKKQTRSRGSLKAYGTVPSFREKG